MILAYKLACILLLLSSCSKYIYPCNHIDQKIDATCKKVGTQYAILARKLVDFKWDSMFIIPGPTFQIEIEEELGIKYKDLVEDGSTHYIFLNNGKLVTSYVSYCRDFRFLSCRKLSLDSAKPDIIPSDTLIFIRKSKGESPHWINCQESR